MSNEFFEKISQLIHNFEILIICFNVEWQIASINDKYCIAECIGPNILNGLFVIIDQVGFCVIFGLALGTWFRFGIIFIRIITEQLINIKITK